MLGSFGVGKTSLVQQFVYSLFSEKYLTTIGVKVDKKTVSFGSREVQLLIWDIYGEETFQKMQATYLRGASGYLLVVDGTRKDTLAHAYGIREKVEMAADKTPFALILNKSDLSDHWEIEDSDIEKAAQSGLHVLKTSAKTGENVDQAFQTLTDKIMNNTA